MSAQEQTPKLSDGAVISLITFSPGDAFYTAFGHTALRVRDSESALDVAYNYGTFDFDDPAFYLNFVRGRLMYILNVESFDLAFRTYEYFDRSITEQVLHLSQEEKQSIFEYLDFNARPENRAYAYSFFYDNCSTRPRDAIRHVLGDKYTTTFEGDQRSFREIVHERGAAQPWTRLGAQLLLGSPTDTKMDLESSAFLPDNLFYEFAAARNGGSPLVSRTDTLFAEASERSRSAFPWPMLFFWLVFICAFAVSILRDKKTLKWEKLSSFFDSTLLFFTGLIGVVLLFMWFGTSHGSTDWNLNILWANPVNLILAYFIARGKKSPLTRTLFLVSIIGVLSAILLGMVGPQRILSDLMPLIFTLILRLSVRFSRQRSLNS